MIEETPKTTSPFCYNKLFSLLEVEKLCISRILWTKFGQFGEVQSSFSISLSLLRQKPIFFCIASKVGSTGYYYNSAKKLRMNLIVPASVVLSNFNSFRNKSGEFESFIFVTASSVVIPISKG